MTADDGTIGAAAAAGMIIDAACLEHLGTVIGALNILVDVAERTLHEAISARKLADIADAIGQHCIDHDGPLL